MTAGQEQRACAQISSKPHCLKETLRARAPGACLACEHGGRGGARQVSSCSSAHAAMAGDGEEQVTGARRASAPRLADTAEARAW